MVPRSYRLGKRAESVDETRRRIVQAVFELHDERGVSGTTMKLIADRAGVGIGTVYHHFPSYDDCIRACGELTAELVPWPEPADVTGDDLPARLDSLVRRWSEFHARLPGLDRVRAERSRFESIDAWMRRLDGRLDEMAAAALRLPFDDPRVKLVAAVLDMSVHEALLRRGLVPADAATWIAALLRAWLVPDLAAGHPPAFFPRLPEEQR